ncbi:response regulator transcription factor, partial [Achromobacter ruhlandii]
MPLNLLIVDDHLIIRRGLARILQEDPRVGLVREAADAPAALRALRQEPFDAMVLDVALGERDGLDVPQAVRADPPAPGGVLPSVYPASPCAVRA